MTDDSAKQPPESLPAEDVFDESGGGASFPVVGVGASAGRLEAFTQLLTALPADTGMAFVLVQHLAPSHPSALAEILSRATTMPVLEVRDEPTVEPNHVYVIRTGYGLRGQTRTVRTMRTVFPTLDRVLFGAHPAEPTSALMAALIGSGNDGQAATSAASSRSVGPTPSHLSLRPALRPSTKTSGTALFSRPFGAGASD